VSTREHTPVIVPGAPPEVAPAALPGAGPNAETDAGPDVAEHFAEHFQDLDQQHQAARLGMWVFLSSETLLFAGLFGLLAGYRIMYTADFLAASHHNSVVIGTANTAILITSSFTAAWALHSVRHGARRMAALCLAATVAFGLSFLGLKAIEYLDHFHHGIYPGIYYRFAELPAHGARLFFTLYYFLTGLHALHVIGGMVFLGLMIRPVWKRRYTERHHVAVENGVLYWHLVDLVWIFLWPLLYLVG
jgi:cytochrome c oxidase subunit 3